ARADEHRALAPLLGAACLGASVPGAARLTYVSALAPGYLPAAPPAPQSSRRLRRQDRAASHLRRTGVFYLCVSVPLWLSFSRSRSPAVSSRSRASTHAPCPSPGAPCCNTRRRA